MTNPRRLRAALLALLLGAVLALAGCTQSVTPKNPPPTPTLTTATPTVSVSTSATPTPTASSAPTNPFTGIGPVPKGSAVAVKIDDTRGGRPQRGVDLADIVYIEQAEGGLSRLVAVFGTNKPTVEAVRSVRASDSELLSQYGAITMVASGGGGDALPTLYASILHPVIHDRGDSGFSFDDSRDMPYNTTANLAAITAREKQGNPPQYIGFTWSPTIPEPGPAATTFTTTVGSTQVSFVYDPASHRYFRLINGVKQKALDGHYITTPNVIVQFCTITPNPHDVDVNGVESEYTHTIGTGPVTIFRNGQRITGTWARGALKTPTFLLSPDGTRIPLNPGGAWVVLVAKGTTLTSR